MNTEIPAEAVERMKREGWPSIEDQKAYWERECTNCGRLLSDCNGNCIFDELSRTEATCDWFDSRERNK